MKNFFKILAGLVVAVLLLGWLLPDPKKAGATEAAGTTPAAAAAPEKPALEVLQTSETSNEYASTVHVKVRNNTNRLVSYLDLKSVYYNKKGTIVGTGMGNAVNLAAGATKTIDVQAMGVDNASRFEVELGNVMY